MDFFNVGSNINIKDYNSLVYFLRKFKRLTAPLRLGALNLTSDYGSFVFDKALTSIGNNFIIEEEVTVSSSNCLKNCFYSFIFTVIDVNTSGTVNKREVKVTGNTGENGTLSVTLPTDLIESDEVILPYFELDIVFDPHEYYTPVVDAVNVELESTKAYVFKDETATITATLTDRDGKPITSVPCTFTVNGEAYPKTTDENGQAEFEYTGTGIYSKIDIQVITTTLTIYDTPLTANVRGNYIRFIGGGENSWLNTDGDCVIDWGDDTSTTVNNPTSTLIHDYTDGEQTHTIAFLGVITGLGDLLFANSGLNSINIPSTVTSFGRYCFNNCDLLTSISIPSSVISIGDNCFKGCYDLVDYQLYWSGDAIVPYDSNKMPNNNDTVFTIPHGQTSNYIAKGYPSAKLNEKSGIITILTLESSKSSYYTDESITLTGLLVDEDNNPLSSTRIKVYYNGILMAQLNTNGNGKYTMTLTPGMAAGNYTFKAMYGGDSTYEASTSSDCSITVQNHTYSLSIATDKQSMYSDESIIISGVLLKDNTAFSSQSVDLYDGITKIDTLTTDGSGNYSKTITGLSSGVHTFKAAHINAESSTVSVTVNEHAYSLSVDSTKDILSYDDSESATITGTLTDGGVAVAGETLSYVIKHGSTTISTGSDTTDSNGQISFSYTATGVGDVTIEVDYSSLLQETFVIQDCDYYGDSTKISNWNNVSSGGTQFKVSSYSIGLSNFSVEMKFNSIDAQIMVGNQSSWLAGVSLTDKNLYTHSSSGGTVTQSLSTPIASDVWRIEVEGTTIRLYRNDNIYITKTNCKVDYPKTLRLYPQNKSASVDYVKVKAL